MKIEYKFLIQSFLEKNTPKSFTFMEIVKILKIPVANNFAVTTALKQLLSSKAINKTVDDRYVFLKPLKSIKGIFKLAQRNFGFIDVSETESYYVGKEHFNNAMDGFEVQANVYQSDNDKTRTYAIINKIISDGSKELIGVIEFVNGKNYFKPYNPKYRAYRFFWDPKFENLTYRLKNKDIVKSLVTKINGEKIDLKYLKTISNADLKLAPVDVVLETYNVDTSWPTVVNLEAQKIEDEVDAAEYKNRVDLREQLIVTIDGNDTKDFDDAVSVVKEDKLYKLSVHIADVSHYIKENSEIDKEALKRGTSIYLPHIVVPMLPEKLSNGICSLNPNVDRLVLSADIWIDEYGNNVKTKIYQAVINSKYRLTYDTVNDYYEAIKNDTVAQFKEAHKNWTSQLQTMLLDALELSKIIRQKKISEGYIDLEIVESKVILDHNGASKEIKLMKQGISEALIEDFMVRANEVVATEFEKLKLPCIFRIHDNPDMESLTLLENTLKLLSLDVKVPKSVLPLEFAKVISEIKQKSAFDDFLKIMVLRTMQKAVYSETNHGHFGLASKAYSHFTSPIRRYPDLILHRMIRRMMFNQNNKNEQTHFNSILHNVSLQASTMEQQAMQVERQVNDIKKAEFYERNIGKVLPAQIVSILNFGMFVEFPDKVSAMIHMSNLLGDEYKTDENRLKITGHKKSFKVGDHVDVVVVKIDDKFGKVDAVLADDYQAYLQKEANFKLEKQNQKRQYENSRKQ